jgi:hypothetical protein
MSTSDGNSWIVVHAVDATHGDLVVRLDEAADSAANKRRFSMRLGTAVELSNPSEFTILDPLEYQIKGYIEEGGAGILVAVISGTGSPLFREFLCYVRSGFDLGHFRDVVRTRLPHLEIQMYTERDPDLDAFKALKN